MPEYLKALIVILILSSATFMLVRQPACAAAISPADYVRRSNLWLTLTLIAFLAHNFWVLMLFAGVTLALVAARDPNRPALYFFVLFAIPQISQPITGLGVINQFFVLDFVRLLALVVFLPTAYGLYQQQIRNGERINMTDKILIAYLLLNIALQFLAISFTGTMRNAFYSFIDVFLPYYVLSRSLRTYGGLRDATTSFVIAGLVLAVIGIFEFSRHWLLYYQLDGALGIDWNYGGYLEREETLRAMATTGQSIVFGYVVATAFGLFLYARNVMRGKLAVTILLALLLGGLIASLSRGPWVGAGIMLVIYLLAAGRRAPVNFAKLALAAVILLPALYMTPYWEKLIDYLPFVGEVDAGNITYRQRLLEISIQIILENPLFGSSDFIYFLEELRQGQGIIDIVNSFLMIALRSGLVGLSLFLVFFGTIMVGIVRRMKRSSADGEIRQLGQALLATLGGILVMIFTVSSINAVPVVYWALAGLGLAYAQMADPAPATR
ncbi:MAG: O-antigen ligase family protein [Pseudomonadota bacterium]